MRNVKREGKPEPATPMTRTRKRVACVFAALGGLLLFLDVALWIFGAYGDHRRIFCFCGLFAGKLLLVVLYSAALLLLFGAFVVGALPAWQSLFFRLVAAGAAGAVLLFAIWISWSLTRLVEQECYEIRSDDGAHTVVFVATYFFDVRIDVYERENPFVLRRLRSEERGTLESVPPLEPSYYRWENDGFYVKYGSEWRRYYYHDIPKPTPYPSETESAVKENPEERTAAP